MAAGTEVTFFWQCERKEKITLDASETVSKLRLDVAAQLEEDYTQPDKDLDCSDVKLYLNGEELSDSGKTLQNVGIVAGSVVSAVSVAVAEAVGERKKIKCTREVFASLRDTAGKVDAKVEEAALKQAEPFDLCCSTMSLGELGAGWPILFNFICLLILLLLGLFLIHIPTMFVYGLAGNIAQWPVEPVNETISSAMLTAGNLGPEGSDTMIIGWVSLIGGIFTLVMATMMSRKIGVVEKAIDITEVDATDFGLFVENLPSDVVNEKEVKEWMEENLLDNQTTQVVKVVIGYDMAEYKRLRKELGDMKKTIADCIDPREKASLQEKYKGLNKTMTDEDLFHQAVGGSGSAVVITRYQTDHRQALSEWNSCRERFARCCGCLGGIPSLSLKPKFHHNGEDVMLTITRADNPDEIIWENLSVPWEVKCKARLRVFGLLFCVFVAAFIAIMVGRFLQIKFDSQNWALVIAGLAIGISTIVVFMFSKSLIDSERHETKTRRDISLMLSFTTTYAMNYNLALLLANLPNWFGNPGGIWYESKGLLTTIFMLQIGTAFIYPLFYATPCKQYLGSCIRACLGGLSSIRGGDTAPSQAKLNKMYAPPEIDTARVYAQMLKVYYLGLFYTPVMPLGGLVCGIGLIMFYWSLKYYLLRKCARPYRQSPKLAYVAVKCVFAGTAAYAFSQWFFLRLSLQAEGEFWSETVMWALLGSSIIMIILPRQIYQYLLCTCLCFPRSDEDIDREVDYYDVQKAWAKHQKYHTANDVYLFMEIVYAAKKRQFKEKYTPPWELKTGNLPKPGDPTTADASAGPEPGALGIAAGAKAGDDAEEVELGDDEDIDAPAETAALASADPAELALEEMKYKLDLAALGALTTDSGDSGSEAALSESGDESTDEEAPLASSGRLKPGMTATIDGLESSAGTRYNGTTCTVMARDEETGKWRCELEDGTKANLPESKLTPEAATLAPGALVLLDGLTATEQYNGTEATIVSFDSAKKGYNVTLFTGVKACVKPWNLRPV